MLHGPCDRPQINSWAVLPELASGLIVVEVVEGWIDLVKVRAKEGTARFRDVGIR